MSPRQRDIGADTGDYAFFMRVDEMMNTLSGNNTSPLWLSRYCWRWPKREAKNGIRSMTRKIHTRAGGVALLLRVSLFSKSARQAFTLPLLRRYTLFYFDVI